MFIARPIHSTLLITSANRFYWGFTETTYLLFGQFFSPWLIFHYTTAVINCGQNNWKGNFPSLVACSSLNWTPWHILPKIFKKFLTMFFKLYNNSLVNANLFYMNFTITQFEKVSIPHLRGTMWLSMNRRSVSMVFHHYLWPHVPQRTFQNDF